ncbi:hypothetical protein HanXRQr2_Chr05g0232471 [Helianthus annuus]|uniref:Knottin, scorpion toxin-like protein n=1 Tax=Helianthus annuus TaxID=4232 RepID=A0A251V5Q3_HELAN|nr:hypothetical protein HanXRQr2_Chr05g0232471 [Helianthus annuus]KAJ0924089.1 hypothetical protein HanPSC8_Chr05g0224201 [Helianthus annuus]
MTRSFIVTIFLLAIMRAGVMSQLCEKDYTMPACKPDLCIELCESLYKPRVGGACTGADICHCFFTCQPPLIDHN